MLKRLRIKNFALIEDLDLLFCPGFNVITGETGAGKSIIIGALNLLFGDRASVEMYREGEEHLIVEGAFEQPRSREELIIRREMYRGGKSYIFINDIQNTLQTLRDTTSGLAELMGQHQHQTLLNQSNHMEILDRFGNLESKLKEFRDSFTKWKSLKLEIGNLIKSRQERTERVDYLKFQLSEIEFAKLSVEGEQGLAREREILKNSGKIKDLTSAIYSALYDNDDSVFENVNTVRAQIKELKEIDNKAPFKEEDIESLYILAEEVGKLAA
ncbi:MAG: AAA family ATPase, partial [candidate division Zixibacteria bacterium]|nr:AAA family ATPase [candidate division Zixibacteria bacterium]